MGEGGVRVRVRVREKERVRVRVKMTIGMTLFLNLTLFLALTLTLTLILTLTLTPSPSPSHPHPHPHPQDICISIENQNKTRQFCCLTIDELTTLLGSCPVTNRALYECISSNRFVKTYVDFEYLIAQNLDIQDHCIGPTSCLKILYYFPNVPDDTINTIENYNENILKQFLVLDA